MTESPTPKTVLFLCTGNYYRSRFAENLFNHLAEEAGMAWRAKSRALAYDPETRNAGSISPHVPDALRDRGVMINPPYRSPREAVAAEIFAADRVIALCEREHRPLVDERFPECADEVEYWQVEDVDVEEPERALACIEKEVRSLIRHLGESES